MKLQNTNTYLYLAVSFMLAMSMSVTLAEAGGRDRFSDNYDRSRHGDVITETRHVADFSRIKIHGLAEVEITFGDEFFVEVEAGEDVIDYFETIVSGKTLRVGLEDYDWDFDDLDWNFSGGDPLIVRITMPKLEELRIKGIGSVSIDGFDGDELELTVAGIGDVRITNFKGTLLDIRLAGIAALEVDGETDELNIILLGIGDADLRDLRARDVYAKVKGMGDLRVYASDRLDAYASGFGDIYYYGNPSDVTREERGFGDIVAKR